MNQLAIRMEHVQLPTAECPAPSLSSQELHSRLVACTPTTAIQRGILTKADLPALRSYHFEACRLCRPCKPEVILYHITKLMQHYPQTPNSPEANATRLADWVDDMKSVPEDWLIAACADWRRSDERFAPSPGQLLKLVQDRGMRGQLARRAKEAIELLEAA